MIDNNRPPQPPQPDSVKPKLPSNFEVLTFSAPCPSCGAPVEFASPGSVMAVCEYCQTTVLRDGKALKAQGKQSLTIEDYSPLQIGSVGRFEGTDFALIGRVQLRYSQGVWNEWYVQFADGRNGWLTEALGQYSLTVGASEATGLPTYDALSITDRVDYEGISYSVSDKREATAIAGEGELPFVVGKGWQTWGIDAQYKRQFITLDYAENGPQSAPMVYHGQVVQLNELSMQMLKQAHQVSEQVNTSGAAAFGTDSGSASSSSDNSNAEVVITKIDCPNCGSPIPYVQGATEYLFCPSCHSEVQITGSKADLIKMHSTMQHFDSSLPLGAKARIDSTDLIDISEVSLSEDEVDSRLAAHAYHDYIVIGIMHLNEVGEYASWTEYLLYSLTDGFLWLSEESSGWYAARVLSEMPVTEPGQLIYNDKRWRQVDSGYRNRVVFAMGAFNWQVKTDDSDLLIDYVNGDELITSEQTEREITYTHAKPVDDSKLQQWFGQYLSVPNDDEANAAFAQPGSLKKMLQWQLLSQALIYFIFNGSLIVAIIGAIIIYLVYFKGSESAKQKADVETITGPFHYHTAGVQGFAIVVIVLSALLSVIIGNTAAPSATGPSSTPENTENTEEAQGSRGGGIIIIPGGFGGGSNNSSSGSGRTGYSSGGSHK
ncbi:DUF4178 domain-containing protein [Psychrobacter sp. FDAARGOS_221]|uniref:DUF4178 domain-containing protein n=1 Tax=Psychrobacter sp. FDAARGOS_221 TaxID=1975705 RepID=UPI000BB546F5|nr:DUF4178 domain-containing protein [Psychrobacter sp. FDAARGOS_221]PNK59778.1 DUF4178 domain-containing protein [Psychrobacter sp. FDAARGOS_221]